MAIEISVSGLHAVLVTAMRKSRSHGPKGAISFGIVDQWEENENG